MSVIVIATRRVLDGIDQLNNADGGTKRKPPIPVGALWTMMLCAGMIAGEGATDINEALLSTAQFISLHHLCVCGWDLDVSMGYK